MCTLHITLRNEIKGIGHAFVEDLEVHRDFYKRGGDAKLSNLQDEFSPRSPLPFWRNSQKDLLQ